MSFLLGIVIGLLAGGSLGLLVACMLFAARRGDDLDQRQATVGR
jgi:hypothetical protein